MGLFRARPFVTAEAVLISGERCAARIAPAPGRPPGTEAADAVIAAAGAVAVAWNRAPESRVEGMRECLVELAQAVASGPPPERAVHLGPLGGRDFLSLEPWGADGRGRVEVEVARNRAGHLVPRLAASPEFAGPSVEVAALALVQHAAGGPARDADARLALALSVEGVLAWYREGHQLTPPGDALAYALAHAGERMDEAGRTTPPGLAD